MKDMTRHASNFRLFDGFRDLDEVKEDHISKVDTEFMDVSAEELIDSVEEEFIDDIMKSAGIDIPEIDLDDWKAEPAGSGGNRSLRLPLRVRGNIDLLKIAPTGYDPEEDDSDIPSFGNSLGRGPTLDGRTLIFSFPLGDDPDEVESEIRETIAELETALGALQNDLEKANEEVREHTRQKYQERKERAESTEETLDEIDIPIKDRDED